MATAEAMAQTTDDDDTSSLEDPLLRPTLRRGPRKSAELTEADMPTRTKSAHAEPSEHSAISSSDSEDDPSRARRLKLIPPWQRPRRKAARKQKSSPRTDTAEDLSTPTTKARFDPTAQRRPLSMIVMPAHDGAGDFTTEPDTHKSMSWAEASGKGAKHAFEKIEDGTADAELKRLWEERKTRSVGDGLDGWALDRHIGTSAESSEPSRRRKGPEGWEYVRTISPTAFERLAMDFRPETAERARLVDMKEGQNNLVAIMRFDTGEKVCIRVPCCGSPRVWNQIAKATFNNAVDTMRFLHSETQLKVPNVLAWNHGFSNHIRAPFMITEFVAGTPVDKVWWDDETMERTGDFVTVSPDLERKRQKILRSVATQVVELRTLRFDKYGAFALQDGDVTKPTVVRIELDPFHHILRDYEEDEADRRHRSDLASHGINIPEINEPESRLPTSPQSDLHSSSRAMHQWILDYWLETFEGLMDEREALTFPTDDKELLQATGIYTLFSLMLEYLPFAPGTSNYDKDQDSFVFAQSDFQPQNIFVDEDSNVTGFIDWDFTNVKPRYDGWSQLPLWLCEDWNEEYAVGRTHQERKWPSRTSSASVDLEKYRKDYARYLLQACQGKEGCEDWCFVVKCHLYDAVTGAIGNAERMYWVLHKLLITYVGQYDWDDHLLVLGRDGFQPGLENWYREFFYKLFACDTLSAQAELGMLDIPTELRSLSGQLEHHGSINLRMLHYQEALVHLYKTELAENKKQLDRIERAVIPPTERPSRYPLANQQAADVSWHSFNSNSVYEMSGTLRPPTLQAENQDVPPAELVVEQDPKTAPQKNSISLWLRMYRKIRSGLQKLGGK